VQVATETSVANIMTTSVITVEPDAEIPVAARLMIEHGISGLPVMENGRLVGIITETDVIGREIEVDPPAYGTFLDAIFRLPWDRSDDDLQLVMARTVRDLMTEDVVTIMPDASIHEAASLMFKQGLNPLPVVDREGRLVGIVSRSDIVRLVAETQG
jgi:CBS-domain-containing membrane protein